jgi:two-component system NarL family sensor kinase
VELIAQQVPNGKNSVAVQASETIDRAIQQIRSMSHLLHPPLLDEVGLLSALRWYADGLSARSGIETILDVTPLEFPRLSAEVETAIFRIIQEALTNVFRHSDAHKAWIRLRLLESQVTVSVQDDGKGIADQIESLSPGSIGIGLGGMSQRAKELGGNLRVRNANPGTLLEVTVPFQLREAHSWMSESASS